MYLDAQLVAIVEEYEWHVNVPSSRQTAPKYHRLALWIPLSISEKSMPRKAKNMLMRVRSRTPEANGFGHGDQSTLHGWSTQQL